MKELLNKKYAEIINKYKIKEFSNVLNGFEKVLERGYVFQYDDNEKESDLLFIGMNPSYTEKYEKGQTFSGSYSRNVDRSYFKPFGQINEELIKANGNYNGKWTHFDLLVFRETNQRSINELMKTQIGCEFILEQLAIAKNRLIQISPKVVIVSNSKAGEFLGKKHFIDAKTQKEYGLWMGLKFVFDDEFGSHKVSNIPELKNTHFIFSSMLSGQRALDSGSKERMVWQVKRIFKQ